MRLLLSILVVACSVPSVAQISGTDVWRFGITGSGVLNMHSGPLTTQDGLAECGTFEDATTLGFSIGNSAWYALTPNVALSGRLQYWNANGTFTAPNPVQPLVALSDGSTVPLSTEYTLQTNVSYILLDVIAQWYFATDWYAGIGPQIGFNTLATFDQSESIVQPSFLEFVNGGTDRTIFASSFTNSSVSTPVRLALHAVVGRDIRVSDRFLVTPEIGYAYGFTNVVTGSDWTINALNVGLHVSYAFGLPEPPPPPAATTEPVPAVVPERRVPRVTIDVESIATDGATIPGADLVLSELRSSDVVPLLPFVFFDTQSANMPARYRNKTPGFTEAELQDSVLGIYHHLLNIVGERMQRYSDATLEVAGYREPADGEVDAQLSDRRATAVRDYLVNVWGVDSKRISLSTGVLPPIVSNRGVEDGRTENRRAELRSADSRILAPVTRSAVASTIEPRAIRVKPTIENSEYVQSSTSSINTLDGAVVARVGSDLTWTPSRAELQSILGPRRNARASAVYAAQSTSGEEQVAYAPITVRRDVRSVRYSNEVVNDSVIERFRMIFFDFDAPTVSAFNRSVVDLVRSRIRTTSSVRITGFTDRIGPAERNMALSVSRAAAIDATIKERIVPERVTTRGAGAEAIYNNDLPEGRWYNRTVLIEVATPVDAE